MSDDGGGLIGGIIGLGFAMMALNMVNKMTEDLNKDGEKRTTTKKKSIYVDKRDNRPTTKKKPVTLSNYTEHMRRQNAKSKTSKRT